MSDSYSVITGNSTTARPRPIYTRRIIARADTAYVQIHRDRVLYARPSRARRATLRRGSVCYAYGIWVLHGRSEKVGDRRDLSIRS